MKWKEGQRIGDGRIDRSNLEGQGEQDEATPSDITLSRRLHHCHCHLCWFPLWCAVRQQTVSFCSAESGTCFLQVLLRTLYTLILNSEHMHSNDDSLTNCLFFHMKKPNYFYMLKFSLFSVTKYRLLLYINVVYGSCL